MIILSLLEEKNGMTKVEILKNIIIGEPENGFIRTVWKKKRS